MGSTSDSPAVPFNLAALRGTVLEQRYEVGRVLGAGGMGAVFAGRHLRLGRPVAIKVLQPAFAGHEEYVQRFLREAQAVSKVRHRNVVELHDFGEAAGGLVYSVMEFLVGQDLEQLLATQPDKRMPWSQARPLLLQVAQGLKAAHGQGVIHRDIKPANCFLTEEDGEPVVKLVDFGIAKLEGPTQGQSLTGVAQMLGTPSYMAPELVRTESPPTPRSDIYSFGVLAYRMLVGRVPFSGETVFELLRHACFDPVPSLCEQVPGLPPEVETFVVGMLAKAAKDRPADMRTVREQLEALPSEDVTVLARVRGRGGARADEKTVVRRVTVPTAMPRTVVSDSEATVVRRPPPTEEHVSPLASSPAATAISSPPGGDTVPNVGESTLRGLEESGAIERPPGQRRMGVWVAASLGAAALGLVALMVAMPESEPPSDVARAERADAVAESANDEPVTPMAVGTAPPEPEPEPETDAAPSTEVPAATEEDTAIVIEDEPDDRGFAPTEPSEADGASAPTKKGKRPSTPSDRSVIKGLKRKIAAQCSVTGALKVSFLVTAQGGIVGANANPPGAGGDCAKKLVRRAKFRKRKESAAIQLSVGGSG